MKIRTRKIALLLMLCAAIPARAALTVFSCEPEWAALAGEIGGDRVKVFSATTAMQDPHYIQARPSLIAKARGADLLFCTGAELEAGWLPMVLRKARNNKISPGQPGHLMAAEQVELLEIPQQLDRSMGDVHASGNPHMHLDPHNILRVAEVLQARLISIDGGGAELYRTRFDQFKDRWQDAIGHWDQQAGLLRGKKVVVHHKEWTYLLHWLGLERIATLEPKPGVPPNAGHLSALKQQLSQTPATAIVRSPINDPRPGEWLSNETGIPVLVLPYTVGGSEDTKTLQALFDDILKQLLDLAQ